MHATLSKSHEGLLLLPLVCTRAHGLVNCGYTNSGWEAVELQASVGCTTTLPSQAQREDIDIREQATSRRYKEPCTHPSLPRQQAWNSPHKTSSNNAPAHPQQQQHDHVNEPCLKYSKCSLPTMCRPKAPTKTHTCSDWVKGDTECQTNHTPQQPTAHSDQTFPFAIALIATRPADRTFRPIRLALALIAHQPSRPHTQPDRAPPSRPHTQTNKTFTRPDRAPPQPTAHSA